MCNFLSHVQLEKAIKTTRWLSMHTLHPVVKTYMIWLSGNLSFVNVLHGKGGSQTQPTGRYPYSQQKILLFVVSVLTPGVHSLYVLVPIYS